MIDYEKRLVNICDRITKLCGWDIDEEAKKFEETGSRRITATERLKKAVYKAKSEAGLNYGRGIASLYDRIQPPERGYGAGWINCFGYAGAESFTESEIDQQYEFAYVMLDLVKLYKDYTSGEFEEILSNIVQQAKFDEDFRLHPSILEAVNDAVNKGHFKVHKYHDAGDKIMQDDKFHVSNIIGFSSDLNMWFDHLKSQHEFMNRQADNEVFTTMFGKLDEVHPLYSSWMLTLHKGDTIWLVTDQMNFDNPRQKHTRLGRKSVWRDRDETYDACDLPYDLFHDLDAIREGNNSVAKTDAIRTKKAGMAEHCTGFQKDGTYSKLEDIFKKLLDDDGTKYDVVTLQDEGRVHWSSDYKSAKAKKGGRTVAYWSKETDLITFYDRPEVLFKNFDSLPDGQRAFIILLMNELVRYCSNINLDMDTVMLASEFVEMKLLTGEELKPVDGTTRMTYWIEQHKEKFEELRQTLDAISPDDECTAITPKSYGDLVLSERYDSSWLATAEKLESMTEWTLLDSERQKLSVKLYKLRQLHDEGEEWFNKILTDKYDYITNKLKLAKEIEFVTGTYSTFTTDGDMGVAGYVHHYDTSKKSSSRRKLGMGVGKRTWQPEDCLVCLPTKITPVGSKSVITVHIRHYKELMWILGIKDRMELHPYYQNYRSHDMIAYDGNSLLDQTHPYLSLDDPLSRRKPNGMDIEVFMCGHCYRKYKTRYKKVAIKHSNFKAVMGGIDNLKRTTSYRVV